MPNWRVGLPGLHRPAARNLPLPEINENIEPGEENDAKELHAVSLRWLLRRIRLSRKPAA